LSWEKPGIGRILVFLVFQIVFYWTIIILIEFQVFRNIKYFFASFGSKKKSTNVTNKEINSSYDFMVAEKPDEDVLLEEKRLESTGIEQLTESDALIIKNLTKNYGSFCAVDNISYGVRKGECFGLLGVNGAGKTTTFKMITGDEPISSGDIYVNGFNVKNSIQKVQRQIGYCPQFDGLLDQLTGRETLTLFCRLRGIKEYEIPIRIDEISRLLYFDVHINKLVGKYSGGTKRKLSTAVVSIKAFISNLFILNKKLFIIQKKNKNYENFEKFSLRISINKIESSNHSNCIENTFDSQHFYFDCRHYSETLRSHF
jgi:ATP-binding cassette subfamily A (ABC1) protein 3